MKLLSVACCLSLLAGCATPVDRESQIEERVNGRWSALFSDDLAGAYEYLSPGYRSSVSSVQYQRSILLQRVRWTNAEYLSGECEATVCKVEVLVGFTIYGALPGAKSFSSIDNVRESWVLAKGQWYFVPED